MVNDFAKLCLTTILLGPTRFNNTLHSDEQTNLQVFVGTEHKKCIQKIPSKQIIVSLISQKSSKHRGRFQPLITSLLTPLIFMVFTLLTFAKLNRAAFNNARKLTALNVLLIDLTFELYITKTADLIELKYNTFALVNLNRFEI